MYKLLLNELDKKLEEEAECDDEGNDSEFDDNDDNSDDDNEEVQAEGFEQQEELYVEDEIKSDDKNDQVMIMCYSLISLFVYTIVFCLFSFEGELTLIE